MRWGRSEGAGSSAVRASGQQAKPWRNRMDEQKPAGKPFEILKQEVWDAWLKVKANGGAPGNTRDFRCLRHSGLLSLSCSVLVFESGFVVPLPECGHGFVPRVAAGMARGSTV